MVVGGVEKVNAGMARRELQQRGPDKQSCRAKMLPFGINFGSESCGLISPHRILVNT